jgi:V/A-type H+-transporting ATPase subunit A
MSDRIGQVGQVTWINGPVVRAHGSRKIGMLEVVEIGDEHLVGEVIGLEQDIITIQVYEETSGLRPGAPVFGTGSPLSVELGPGLLGSIFDGIQRPLPVLELRSGAFIGRGIKTTPLYRKDVWAFTPSVEAGQDVQEGSVLGSVPETTLIEHRIMVPPDTAGRLTWIASEGEYTIVDPIARIETAQGEQELTMLQRWSVRRPRPYARRLPPRELLVTGQRVLDTFFPLAKGGTAAIPGGFGAGKSVAQQQVAKWSDADIIVYIGCGERGNEMTGVLLELTALTDPHTGRPLIERTILIANTSNMPVAAREASIYTGITLAEMPAEEGFPAYLAARLAEFYERAGHVETFNSTTGSVSIIGAVSPPGGDFSEPVTQHTTRFIRCFWALDKTLASARHFPAVNWLDSYSEYADEVEDWWREKGFEQWHSLRERALELLQRESHLDQIVKLVGPDALPDDQRLILETARMLREGFLQQNALDAVDSYAPIGKQIHMLEITLHFHDRAARIIAKGCPIVVIRDQPIVNRLLRMKTSIPEEGTDEFDEIHKQLDEQMDEVERLYQ